MRYVEERFAKNPAELPNLLPAHAGHWSIQVDREGKPVLPKAREKWPILGLDHEQAKAFADWVARDLGQPVRLPTQDDEAVDARRRRDQGPAQVANP